MLGGACLMRMVCVWSIALLLASTVLQAAPADEEGPLGVWLNEKSTVAVRIVPCGAELCGRIVWLAKPYHDNGTLKRDRHNPNAGERQQPLCGLRVLEGFRQTSDDVWDDVLIYDPRKGETFHSYLTLAASDELRVRAYIGLPLFGKTQIWHRTEAPAQECPHHSPTRHPSAVSGRPVSIAASTIRPWRWNDGVQYSPAPSVSDGARIVCRSAKAWQMVSICSGVWAALTLQRTRV